MNLKSRLIQLEKHQPQIDREQRQAMIASIQQWMDELAVKAQTDREARLHLEANGQRRKPYCRWKLELDMRERDCIELRQSLEITCKFGVGPINLPKHCECAGIGAF